MAFSKVKIGQSFTVNGISYQKTCGVSAESAHHIRLFGASDIVNI